MVNYEEFFSSLEKAREVSLFLLEVVVGNYQLKNKIDEFLLNLITVGKSIFVLIRFENLR